MSGPYGVIYADPPWQYRNNKGQGVAENHYNTMNLDELKALPVGELAAKDCALFLWITSPMLCEAWGIFDAWGFAFKTVAFAWVKVNKKDYSLFTGLGWWTRANVELCLLATRGHPKRQDNTVHQIVMSRVERHSKKPDEVRRRIELLMGDVPRAELFAREVHPGWVCVGDEIDGMDIRDAIEQLKGKEVQDGFSGTDGAADGAGGGGIREVIKER